MKWIVLIILAFWANALWAQKVVLVELGDDCLTHMENRLKIFAKNVDEESLVFTTDSGKVSLYRDVLIFKTNRPGEAHFKVYKRQRGKLVLYDSVKVMVCENKYAEIRIGTRIGGAIDQKELVAIGALIAMVWTRTGHTDPIGIESYAVVFHKNDGTVLVQKNTGNRFNEATIQVMKDLQPGERVTFTNIQLRKPLFWPGLEAKPVEYTIR